MAIDSVEPSPAHGSSQTLPPVPDAETKPQPGNHPSHSGHDMLHPRRPIFWMRPDMPTPAVEAAPGASAQAIIAEVEACAARFAATGEDASIDLRFLKAMPKEREMLSSLLGQGEVSATVDALGRTEIRETAIPCVWWVRHRNSEDETIGELIEITEVPEMIAGDRMAVVRGLEALRTARSAQTAPPYQNAR